MEDHGKRRGLADTGQGTKITKYILTGARRIIFKIQTELELMVSCEILVPTHYLNNL